MSETQTLKERVLAYIEATDHVSYAELGNQFAEFKDGEFALFLRENLLLWANMTQEATRAINELQAEKLIWMQPSTMLVYLIDGHSLSLPIAKRVQDYKKPHWAPVTLRPAKALPTKARRRQ